jgi:hypothetical protein
LQIIVAAARRGATGLRPARARGDTALDFYSSMSQRPKVDRLIQTVQLFRKLM